MAMAKPKRYDTLHMVSELPPAEMKEAIRLLEEYFSWTEQEEAIDAAKKMIKEKLCLLSDAVGYDGFRWGHLAVYDNGEKVRKSLSKTKLIENGVSAEVIKNSYTTSKPFRDLRVVDLNKPRKSHGDDEDDDD